MQERSVAALSPAEAAAHARSERVGIFLAIITFSIGGFMLLFMKLLDGVSPVQIVAHRVVWCFLFVAILSTAASRWKLTYRALKSKGVLPLLILSTLLIGVHWLIFIWAVLNGQVFAASLGYFINPLLSVALGMLVLGERLRPVQLSAITLAGIGVSTLFIDADAGVFIALSLASSFALYGLVRKMVPIDALSGQAVELGLLLPIAATWLLWLGSTGAFGHNLKLDILLVLSGAIMGVPLLLFAVAAKRIKYSTLGLIQYIVPTLQFFQAFVLFDEPLKPTYLFAFISIWAGLALYACGSLRKS